MGPDLACGATPEMARKPAAPATLTRLGVPWCVHRRRRALRGWWCLAAAAVHSPCSTLLHLPPLGLSSLHPELSLPAPLFQASPHLAPLCRAFPYLAPLWNSIWHPCSRRCSQKVWQHWSGHNFFKFHFYMSDKWYHLSWFNNYSPILFNVAQLKVTIRHKSFSTILDPTCSIGSLF